MGSKLGMKQAVASTRKTGIYSDEDLDIHSLKKKNPHITLLNYHGKLVPEAEEEEEEDEEGKVIPEEDEDDEDGDDKDSKSDISQEKDDDSADLPVDDEYIVLDDDAHSDDDDDEIVVLEDRINTVVEANFDFEECLIEEADYDKTNNKDKEEEEDDILLETQKDIHVLSSKEEEEEPSLEEKEDVHVPSFIHIKGEKTYIAHIISAYFKSRVGGEVLKSVERTQRVGGGLARGALKDEETPTKPESEDRVYVYDYVAVLVSISSKPTMIVTQIIALRGPGESVHRHEDIGLSLVELGEPKSCLTVRPLKAVASKAVEGGTLEYHGDASSKEFSVGGCFTQVLSLDVQKDSLGASISELEEVNKVLVARISEHSEQMFRLIHKCNSDVIHRDHLGVDLFRSAAITKEEVGRVCEVQNCGCLIPTLKAAKAHHGYHVAKGDFNIMTCPYCHGPDLQCSVYLVKNQPKVVCIKNTPTSDPYNLGYAITFNMKPMKKITSGSPCTNVPIVCPLCFPDLAEPHHLPAGSIQSKKRKIEKRPAVWKHNMGAHFLSAHSNGSGMPPGLQSDIMTSDIERAILLETKGLKKYTGNLLG